MVIVLIPFNLHIPQPQPKDVTCLAYVLYHESRGESIQGKLWVAKGGGDICKTIYKPHQFPWTKYPHTYDRYHYTLANIILTNPHFLPKTQATHFHNHTVKPNWSDLCLIKRIGNHFFYKKCIQ